MHAPVQRWHRGQAPAWPRLVAGLGLIHVQHSSYMSVHEWQQTMRDVHMHHIDALSSSTLSCGKLKALCNATPRLTAPHAMNSFFLSQ